MGVNHRVRPGLYYTLILLDIQYIYRYKGQTRHGKSSELLKKVVGKNRW